MRAEPANMHLKDKVAIITGAGSGIGKAIAVDGGLTASQMAFNKV